MLPFSFIFSLKMTCYSAGIITTSSVGLSVIFHQNNRSIIGQFIILTNIQQMRERVLNENKTDYPWV